MKEISLKKLYDLAGEAALSLAEELFCFSQLLAMDYEFHNYFKNPIITKESKLMALKELFPQNSGLFTSLISLLIDEGLEKKVAELAREFSDYVAFQLGLTYVNTRTAFKLSDQEREKISALFKKKAVIREEMDPGLIGGFRMISADRLFLDASLKGSLIRLKEGMAYA